MIKLLFALSLLVLLTSCRNDFDWHPNPYVGDHLSSSLVNADGLTILCNSPEFSTMTAFTEEDIAALKVAIDKVSTPSVRLKVNGVFNQLWLKKSFARNH